MEKCERETLILINQADKEEGFFIFSTTYRPDYQRFCRKVPKDKFLDYRETKESGRVVGWEVKVPYAYLRPASFGIGRPVNSRPKLTLKQKLEMRETLKRRLENAKRKT